VFVNAEFQVAVCRACESEVWGEVSRHFADHHKETSKKHRKEFKAHISRMKLADRQDRVANLGRKGANSEYWCCDVEECSHLSISAKAIRQHCREVHRGIAQNGGKMWCPCRVQSLFGRPYVK
jgi:hypothetical protein